MPMVKLMNKQIYEIPVLPLRDIVIYPQVVVPLYVGRPGSMIAVEEAQKSRKEILLLTQRDSQETSPSAEGLYTVGTVAAIKQFSKLADKNYKTLVEGRRRVKVISYKNIEPFILAEVEDIPSKFTNSSEENILKRSLLRTFSAYLKLMNRPIDDLFQALEHMEDPHQIVDTIATQLPLKLKDQQELLSLEEIEARMERLTALVLSEMEVVKLERKIKGRVKNQIEKNQRDYYLQEQLSAIHKELGDDHDPRTESADLEKRLSEKDMPEAARQKVLKEIKRFKSLPGHSPETSVVRQYIELALDLPWNGLSEDSKDISAAEAILEKAHYGLRDVKDRILEFLAVRMRVESMKSPVICFVGPPGVGKTSLAQSIAHSLNRSFHRISLGGLRDEAELRGHRRTYIGALPGKIISALNKTKTSNPVILLDEIDKIGTDFRGDPASVLLEILDPEQNKFFTDHYLDLEYDLSKVLFIATANSVDPISPPLRDRMEMISLSGYTEDEKTEIASHFILPKELKNHGLSPESVSISEAALRTIIRSYTRESGVRSLEREISKLLRKLVRKISTQPDFKNVHIEASDLTPFLGVPRYRQSAIEKSDEVGLATGLAWTPSGGEVLNVEASVLPGKGNIQITGQLGDVMQESAKAALSYIRSLAGRLQLPENYFSNKDIHIHVPEGAIPKDGPSAGITMATAILSTVMQLPVSRLVGMTGEITLRGRVLPIGGLKQKLMAAQRAGLKTVLFPVDNEKDLTEIEDGVKKGLELIPIFHMDEVLDQALMGYKSLKKETTRATSVVPLETATPEPRHKDAPLHH